MVSAIEMFVKISGHLLHGSSLAALVIIFFGTQNCPLLIVFCIEL
jgi:hypothetical protein